MPLFNIVRAVVGQNGIRRSAKVRIEYELKRSDVVNTLSVYAEAYGFVGLSDFTQLAIRRVVRRMLREHGKCVCSGVIPPNMHTFSPKTVSTESKEWAEQQINRFWPKTEEDS